MLSFPVVKTGVYLQTSGCRYAVVSSRQDWSISANFRLSFCCRFAVVSSRQDWSMSANFRLSFAVVSSRQDWSISANFRVSFAVVSSRQDWSISANFRLSLCCRFQLSRLEYICKLPAVVTLSFPVILHQISLVQVNRIQYKRCVGLAAKADQLIFRAHLCHTS